VIGADHESLEGSGSLNWSDLAACHKDLVIPAEEPSGQRLKHALPKDSFPGAVSLFCCMALGDALVGRRKWVDPLVIRDKETPLGIDQDTALPIVDKTCVALLSQFRGAWEDLKEIEMARVGDNSSFIKQTMAEVDVEMADVR